LSNPSYLPKVIWFTGLSGAGKSTLAERLQQYFSQNNIKSYILDGDNIRKGLCKDLGFSDADRKENIRRVAEVSKLFVDSGTVVLSALISPFNADRQLAKEIIGPGNIIEVFVDCPLEVCEQRDVKGLYKKVRAGEIKNFTGISSGYERPKDSDIVIHTNDQSVDQSVKTLTDLVMPILYKKRTG
jgi:adenylylsulfate kinase